MSSKEVMEFASNKEQEPRSQLVIFTDLDGTLFDHDNYSYDAARPALQEVRKSATPLVFVTSKNLHEIKHLQTEMDLWGKEPFVAENGHGIFIPDGYFSFPLKEALFDQQVREHEGFTVVEFGMDFAKSKEILEKTAKEQGVKVILQSTLTAEEFAQETGLKLPDAERAMKRMYQEGFSVIGTPDEKKEVAQKMKQALEDKGYGLTTGGRYNWMLGGGSKGKAVDILTRLYDMQYGKVTTIGLGDAPNDLEFIEQCDHGYLVANPKKVIEVDSDKVEKVSEPGPEGWNAAVLSLFK